MEYHRKHFKIVSASSMDELVDNLAIQASLRISLGILALEGSASYTRSKACSSSTARVTLHYVNHILSETCRSYPSIDTLNYSLRDLAEKGASHVITSIKYGASADIVFEKHTSSRNEALQIEGSLSVSLGPLIRGEGTVTVDQMQQAAQNGIMMSSETLGMKNLPSLDGMTGEAVLRYVREMGNLTKSDFSNDGKGAPLTMTLTPIKDLYDSAAVLYSSISDNVLEDGVKLLEKLT